MHASRDVCRGGACRAGNLAEGEYFKVMEEAFDAEGRLHVRLQWPAGQGRWPGQPDEVGDAAGAAARQPEPERERGGLILAAVHFD
jgi:hypothetical protein